MNKKAN